MIPEKILKKAKERRLGGVAITDDNTLRGYFKFKKLVANDKDFIVIPGFEFIGLKEIREVLVLGIEYIPKKQNLLDFIDEVRSNGGVCIVPHPFTFDPFIRYRRSLRDLKLFDGIEVINSFDWSKYKEFASKLADSVKIAKIAGSDAHSLRNIGMAYTICEEDPIKAIRKRKTKVAGRESPWSYKISNFFSL